MLLSGILNIIPNSVKFLCPERLGYAFGVRVHFLDKLPEPLRALPIAALKEVHLALIAFAKRHPVSETKFQ